MVINPADDHSSDRYLGLPLQVTTGYKMGIRNLKILRDYIDPGLILKLIPFYLGYMYLVRISFGRRDSWKAKEWDQFRRIIMVNFIGPTIIVNGQSCERRIKIRDVYLDADYS